MEKTQGFLREITSKIEGIISDNVELKTELENRVESQEKLAKNQSFIVQKFEDYETMISELNSEIERVKSEKKELENQI